MAGNLKLWPDGLCSEQSIPFPATAIMNQPEENMPWNVLPRILITWGQSGGKNPQLYFQLEPRPETYCVPFCSSNNFSQRYGTAHIYFPDFCRELRVALERRATIVTSLEVPDHLTSTLMYQLNTSNLLISYFGEKVALLVMPSNISE